MGCGESKNAVATANTISQRKKANEEETIIDKEGEKESHHNGQDLVGEKSENSKPVQEVGHEDEEKAAKNEGDDGIGGNAEEKKESQTPPDQSLPSTDGIDGAVSVGLSAKLEDALGPKISKVEAESAEKKQVLEETETKNQNADDSKNNKHAKDTDLVMENGGPQGENNKEEASSDIQPKASSPDDEQKDI